MCESTGFSDAWGGRDLRLELPACLVQIKGLTTEQRRAIERDYGSWARSTHDRSLSVDVVCHLQRLEKPIGRPGREFSRNGQYVVRKQRVDERLELTGFEFVSHVERGAFGPAQAVLAFHKEQELTDASVLENFLRILLAYRVVEQGGVLLHSVGVVHHDRAFLFSGHSNAGKTTLACKAEEAGVRVLSDDMNLVIPRQRAYRAHKVPFTGEFGRRAENLSGAGSFPLGGLALLEKAPGLRAASLTPAQAVAGLLTGCPFVNDDPEEFPALMDVLTRLVALTPIIRLGVAREDTFEAVMETFLRQIAHG